ncbi:MAG: tetratricopeptide repeat protein [Sphingobacteriaceae bacterium]
MISPINRNRYLSKAGLLVLCLFLFPFLGFAQHEVDSISQTGLKSYFLLRVGLDTDPVDVQNYLETTNFIDNTTQFKEEYKSSSTKLSVFQQSLLEKAFQHALSGNIDAAIRLFEQVASWGLIKNDATLSRGVTAELSSLYALKGQFKQATAYQNKILSSAINSNNTYLQAQCYIQLGKIGIAANEGLAAEDYLLKKALPLVNKFKDKTLLIVCYRELANAYVAQELYAQAKWFYLQSLTLAKQKKDAPGIILATAALAEFKYELGDFEAAIHDLVAAEWTAIQAHELPLLLFLKSRLLQAYIAAENRSKIEEYTRGFTQLQHILLNPGL